MTRLAGLPATVLRSTQFHDLIAAMLRLLAKPPAGTLPYDDAIRDYTRRRPSKRVQ
ncbi:MAG: hypothetical protein ACRDQU_08310 [Pseudonocardiaceae bacterium]